MRTAVALAAISGTAIHLTGIRARRDKPGLALQHLAAVIAVAKTCSAQVEGLASRSQELGFVPGAIQSGNFEFDVGTAGSITLLLQALVPVLLAAAGAARALRAGGD